MKTTLMCLMTLLFFFWGTHACAQAGRFGYKLSMLNLNRFDSNILRLSAARSDFSAAVYPSLTAEYLFSPSTKIAVQYRFGVGRFASTSFFNMDSHLGLLRFSHRFDPVWGVDLYGSIEKSNQPDVLNTRSQYSFASYTQYGEGIVVHWRQTPSSKFSLGYNAHQRSYAGLFINASTRQEDVLHSAGLTWSHIFAPHTFLSLQAGYQANTSNNPTYRYEGPFFAGFMAQALGGGFQLQLYDWVAGRSFSVRPISTNAFVTRSDVVNTATVGIKKNIGENVSLLAHYTFQNDFSNEPLRQFLDHTVTLGVEISLAKSASAPDIDRQGEITPSSTMDLSPQEPTARTLANLGYECLLKGQYDKSLDYSLKAIAIDFNLVVAHTSAGIAYYKKGMPSDSIHEWAIALRLEPTNEKVRALLEKARSEIK